MLPSQPSAAFLDSSTTVVLPKSHGDVYARLRAASSPHSRSHYCEIAYLVDEDARKQLGEQFRQGCKRLPMPEGSLLLWNSKTLHQATLARVSPTPTKPQSHTPLALFQQHVTRCPRVGPLAAAWRSLYAGNPGAAASTLHWSEKPSCRYEDCRPRTGRAWVSRVGGSFVLFLLTVVIIRNFA